MYDEMIAGINRIAEEIDRGENIDFTSIPFEGILQTVGMAENAIGGSSDKTVDDYLRLLDAVTRSGDINALGALLRSISGSLYHADQMIKYSSIDTLNAFFCRRMPEYNYYRNLVRQNEYYRQNDRIKRKPFSGKGVVYTVVVGDYDTVRDPVVINDEWDYILFTDNRSIQSSVWNVQHIENKEELDMNRFSRWCKVLPYEFLKEYEYSVYVDGCMQICGDVKEYIDKYSMDETMLCVGHCYSSDVYEEADLCIKLGKGNIDQIKNQIQYYEIQGFPRHYGLTSNNFIIRNHRDELLKRVMLDWWKEIKDQSARDQISMTYCCWKNDYIFEASGMMVGIKSAL